jgi:plastin-1
MRVASSEDNGRPVLHRELSAQKITGAGGASHTFSEEEKQAFSEHINFCLSPDPLLARHLPLNPDSMDLFEKCNDGLLLCKLINLAVSDAIDERALNTNASMNVYQKTENQNLALNAAKAIGCQVINIGAQDLIEGRPILILGLVWQIIKIQLLSQITLMNFPELVLLLEEGESMQDLMKLHPELILLRWLNYHLRKGGSSRVAKNFGSDLADSEIYSVVLNRLDPRVCPLVSGTEPMARANQAINNARNLGVNVFIKPKDICDGNKKLNISLVAQLFNTCHGLTLEEEQRAAFDLSSLTLDDAGDSREERIFRMWINSLNIEGVYIHNLFTDLQDGYNLLKVEDTVEPGCVNWKRVNVEPKSRFKKVENANYAVDIGKSFKFSLINVAGLDIVDQNKKLILAIIWQLMRKYTLQVLQNLARYEGIREITEDHIITWANAKVASAGRRTTMNSFRDQSLKNSMFLLELVSAIESRAIDWSVVTAANTQELQMMNAKYAISSAMKIGACVFITPEDIVEVKSKMLLTFLASLWMCDLARTF